MRRLWPLAIDEKRLAPRVAVKLRHHGQVRSQGVALALFGARLHVERAAVRLGKSCIQACTQDARSALGGTVSVWMPGRDTSCFACLFPSNYLHERRNEVLPPTVTRLVASVAASITSAVLLDEFTAQPNLFTIQACTLSIEALSIHPRPGCRVCGQQLPSKGGCALK